MRADLLSLLPDSPPLAKLDHDLQMLFEGWFDVGLLTFSEITWESPASTLEKLVEYEAVHRIRSWTDLKNRLSGDRRCYAFFHPKIPGDPLIFVEVALTVGTPKRIAELLDEHAASENPEAPDTAVFYSITNTQRGLRGISFGSFLLKRVMEGLSIEVPEIRRFVTLSPIPGFRHWLEEQCQEHGDTLLKDAERQKLESLLERRGLAGGHRMGTDEDVKPGTVPGENAKHATTQHDQPRKGQIVWIDLDKDESSLLITLLKRTGWWEDVELCEALRGPLVDLCACYLLIERKHNKPLDPVARFHITNGASVDQIQWLGDPSETGLRLSCGLMVNYLYSPEKLERNHESFFRRSEIAASNALKRRATLRGSLAAFATSKETTRPHLHNG